MTNLRAQAAAAAVELLSRRPCLPASVSDVMDIWLDGHSAGFSEGARAFAEWAWSNETLEANVEAELARFLDAHAGTGEVKP